MTTSEQLTGAFVQSFPFFLVAPKGAKTISLPLEEFNQYNEDNTVTQLTIEQLPHRGIQWSVDGEYFVIGLMISELANEHKEVKQKLIDEGYTLGGTNFESDIPTDFWLFNTTEYLKDWKKRSPHEKMQEEL